MLGRATVQHDSTLKTVDTISRDVISQLSGRSKLPDEHPVETIFGFSYTPEAYATLPFIKIRHLPLRQDIAAALGLDDEKTHEFLKRAKVSPAFLADPALRAELDAIGAKNLAKQPAVNQLLSAAEAAEAFLESGLLPPVRMIPPPPGEGRDGKWRALGELMNSPDALAPYVVVDENGDVLPPEEQPIGKVTQAAADLQLAWIAAARASSDGRIGDDPAVAEAADRLVQSLVAVNPEAYPSEFRRKAEVTYNRLGKLTLPGTFVYFVAMVLFLISAYGAFPKMRLWAIRSMLVALAVHTAGIAVRWWLVEKSTGDWFHSIPIKNQFESVMFSAWFGAIVGLVLELRRKKAGGGVFGGAAAFVGFLSLLALFATPHVTGTEIGGNLGHVQGILMSYWLYVHVTTVVASYALIGMSFLLGIWWLVAKVAGSGTRLAPVGLAGVGFWRTLGQAAFLPVGREASRGAFDTPTPVERERPLLERLDSAHVVVLQLAFWLLGTGIILGAIWADQSWGRPWGWDPKETFALVTWIVYLIILHVRLITKNKAMWTAILAIIGFAIMLFNWIGVNFFLVGLHSYA
ncbi:MAG: cytochrome c biogenesis protein CcsA [Planctomycetota bacterium]